MKIDLIVFRLNVWVISPCSGERSRIYTEARLLTSLSAMKYGSFSAIQYGKNAAESTEV